MYLCGVISFSLLDICNFLKVEQNVQRCMYVNFTASTLFVVSPCCQVVWLLGCSAGEDQPRDQRPVSVRQHGLLGGCDVGHVPHEKHHRWTDWNGAGDNHEKPTDKYQFVSVDVTFLFFTLAYCFPTRIVLLEFALCLHRGLAELCKFPTLCCWGQRLMQNFSAKK